VKSIIILLQPAEAQALRSILNRVVVEGTMDSAPELQEMASLFSSMIRIALAEGVGDMERAKRRF